MASDKPNNHPVIPYFWFQPNQADLDYRLQRAKKTLHEKYSLPMELEDVARVAALSRFHFLRQFKKRFQTTPHAYLTKRRIERAKYLLQMGKHNVTDVCFEVGFQSLGSFSSLFRKYVGKSPQSYRQHVREYQNVSQVRPEVQIPACFMTMYKHNYPPNADTAILEKQEA